MAGPGTGGKLPQDFDVIVIGAGPAGVAAAMALLDAGKSVLVLERGPLHPPKLPETLMVETALSLRLSAIVQSATEQSQLQTDVCFITPDGSRRMLICYTPSTAPPLVLVDRKRFDAALRQALLDQGGVILFDQSATAVELLPTGDIEIRHSGQSGKTASKAKLVIDATGKTCFLKSQLNLATAGVLFDQRTGLFSHFIVDQGARDALPAAINIIPLETSFIYAIWIDDVRISIGVSLDQGVAASSADFLATIQQVAWLHKLICAGKQILPVLAVQQRIFQVEQLATPKYFLVGDAGGFADPFFCSGIQVALQTGEYAGQCAREVLGCDMQKAESLVREYAKRYQAVAVETRRKLQEALAPLRAQLRPDVLDPHIPYSISASLKAFAAKLTEAACWALLQFTRIRKRDRAGEALAKQWGDDVLALSLMEVSSAAWKTQLTFNGFVSLLPWKRQRPLPPMSATCRVGRYFLKRCWSRPERIRPDF